MSQFIFKLPDLGEGSVESEIVAWRVQAGDLIQMDDPLVDMMTDKATVEITAPVSGTVLSLAGRPGDVVAVGAELAAFETGARVKKAESVDPETETETETQQAVQTGHDVLAMPGADQTGLSQNPRTSPAIRQRARKAGVDLAQIPGSGPKNRISHADLDKFIATKDKVQKSVATKQNDAVTDIPIIGMRRKIAEKMLQSKRNIPHFAYVEEIDITELESLRQHLNENRAEHQLKLSYLPFVLQALIKVLTIFPQCNARYDDEAGVLRQYKAIHAGIATQTEAGLKVPVVRHVETLEIYECAAAIQNVAAAARANTATKEMLSGSTITITSLGALGGIAVTPIINYPEVAIIGVNKAEERAVVRNGQIVIRRMMNLSPCFDHRFIDGYDAAQMIQHLKRLLEHPASIFM